MGPKTMNAIRAKIGKLTNVAAIKASKVLQSVSTRAMAIIEIVESVGLSAKGRIICWSTAVLKVAATAAPTMK